MWFLNKPPKRVNCFFCNIQVDTKEAFELEYSATDGKGKVTLCPMCAGMLDDMVEYTRGMYDD